MTLKVRDSGNTERNEREEIARDSVSMYRIYGQKKEIL